MQEELAGEMPGRPIHLFGVNAVGAEVGNPDIVAGRRIPWLQDTTVVQAQLLWGVEHFDLVVLDERNEPVAILNLLEHDLTEPNEYAELKAMLMEVAGG
jgi:hypothetical protein